MSMSKLIFIFVLVLLIGSALAGKGLRGSGFHYSRPYKDYWGNRYKHYENLWKDTDRDGIINYYDYNDRNPRIWTPYQKGWK